MEKISIIPAVGAGFQIIRRHPIAVLVWGLVTILLSAIPYLIGLAIAGPAAFGSWQNGDFGAGAMGVMTGASLLADMLGLVFNLIITGVITAAVYRAVMLPDQEKRVAFLRFGATELQIMLLSILLGLLAFAAAFVLILAFALPLGGMAVLAGAGGEPNVGGMAMVLLLLIPIMIFAVLALIYVFGRLWMAAPMIVADGKLRIFEGWAFTRGYGLQILGMNLLVGLLLVGLYLVVAVAIGAFVVVTSAALGVPLAVMQGDDFPLAAFGASAVLFIGIGLILLLLIVSFFQAIAIAPYARAYQLIARSRGVTGQEIFD